MLSRRDFLVLVRRERKVFSENFSCEATSGETLKTFRHRLVLPTNGESLGQHRKSVLNPRVLEDLDFQCDARTCQTDLEKYLRRVGYFSEESLEPYRSFSESFDVSEFHPDLTWKTTGQFLSFTILHFFKDSSPASFKRSVPYSLRLFRLIKHD